MSKIYELNKQIHSELARLAESTGIKVEIESDFYWYVETINYNGVHERPGRFYKDDTFYENVSDDTIDVIEESQIKQILIAFKSVLGENPDYLETVEVGKKSWGLETDQYFTEQNKLLSIGRFQGHLSFIPQSKSQVLANRWVNTTENEEGKMQLPLFDQQPEKVLEEFLEILKEIK